MRPHVRSALRVSENWFYVSLIMARHCQAAAVASTSRFRRGWDASSGWVSLPHEVDLGRGYPRQCRRNRPRPSGGAHKELSMHPLSMVRTRSTASPYASRMGRWNASLPAQASRFAMTSPPAQAAVSSPSPLPKGRGPRERGPFARRSLFSQYALKSAPGLTLCRTSWAEPSTGTQLASTGRRGHCPALAITFGARKYG